jgi:hypothetical protein
MTIKIIIIILLLLIALSLIFLSETFCGCNFPYYTQKKKIFYSPWWNSTRHTRNMSYDLRGDPIIIPKKEYIWNNSDLI